ncbi:GNAT family N-acetyltransferase [uncultured Shewanella sp.]|uniref:GNAT family N-acetyltransferase n=1 Tax=uncultured Shewanella sp. TaxID=173975 RepID=UPI002633DC0C|nr:GNAT family N-acetyltransferase [uncultured Shewanella sp.]
MSGDKVELGLYRYQAQWLTDLEVPLVNKFYRTHGFRGKAKRFENCAVVRYQGEGIIASAYIRDHGCFKLVAGVAVAPTHQGRGVARQLLTLLAERFDEKTYTFPYLGLEPFYASLGFYAVDISMLNETVRQLYLSYRQQGRNIKVMAYTSVS